MDYTIKRGDTLGGLAQRFNTTVKKLADDNHIADPNLIIAGKTLHVPDAEQPKPVEQPQKTDAPAQTTPSTQTQPPQQTQSAPTETPKPTQDTTQVSQQAQDEIAQYQSVDLEEVTKRVQEAQAQQQVEQPPTETAPIETAPTESKVATAPTEEKPKTENPKKSWWDRLIDKGEDMVANTVGKIPLVGGLFKFQSQVTGGALKAVGDMVGGLFNVVAHPIQTLKGVWGLLAHVPFSPPNMIHVANEALHGKGPSEILQEEGTYLKGLWNGITGGYQDAIKEGKWGEIPGRLVVDVGSFLIGAGEANATAKGAAVAGKAAEVAKTAEVAADAGKAAEAIKAAEVAADAGKAADAVKAAEVAADAGKAADAAKAAEVAADAAKAAEVASAAGKAGKIARAVEAFKATSVGKAVLDVGAGLQLMGESVGDFGKAIAKSLRESAGKLPASQLKEAENLAAQAEKLSKQLQEVSLLEGAEGATRMKELLKEAQKLTDATEKVATADKGLRGMANALRQRASLASEVFQKNGVLSRAADIGTVATETAKALTDVGVQAIKTAGRGVGKLPKAVLDQASAFGQRAAALGERAASALGATGEHAAQIYRAMGTESRQLAAEARQLAKLTGDAEYLQLAELYEAEASRMGQVVGVMSLGLPLNAAQGGQEAVEE
ncbi:MAG TPA: LysM peptidoglycan-binding domain-containing protein [Stenomitos sp.]